MAKARAPKVLRRTRMKLTNYWQTQISRDLFATAELLVNVTWHFRVLVCSYVKTNYSSYCSLYVDVKQIFIVLLGLHSVIRVATCGARAPPGACAVYLHTSPVGISGRLVVNISTPHISSTCCCISTQFSYQFIIFMYRNFCPISWPCMPPPHNPGDATDFCCLSDS